MGTARLFGDKAALKALKEGEESGIDDYRECIDGGVPQEMKNALMSIVSKAQQHVSELDRLIDAA
jgi:rubrerythrin